MIMLIVSISGVKITYILNFPRSIWKIKEHEFQKLFCRSLPYSYILYPDAANDVFLDSSQIESQASVDVFETNVEIHPIPQEVILSSPPKISSSKFAKLLKNSKSSVTSTSSKGQGMYKNRIKNNKFLFEIPALLSCERGNQDQENSK